MAMKHSMCNCGTNDWVDGGQAFPDGIICNGCRKVRTLKDKCPHGYDICVECEPAFVSKAAQSLGARGGRARAKKLSKKRRSEIAKKAVEAREAKRKTL